MLETIIAPLLLLAGLYFTCGLRFTPLKQARELIAAFGDGAREKKSVGVSSVGGMLTALAGTAGTGNIVGVAGAVIIGGAGAVFWMWICAYVSIATKYTEVFLAVKYKHLGEKRGVCGPMMYMRHGLGKGFKWLPAVYSVLCVVASIGVGNVVQSNAVSESLLSLARVRYYVNDTAETVIRIGIGSICALLVFYALSGGKERVCKVTSIVVPVMGVAYIIACAWVMIKSDVSFVAVMNKILVGAFNPNAVMGGVSGACFARTMATGVSRGLFSHEAGMGSGAIAQSSAENTTPRRQAAFGIFEVVADTFVICSMTAFMLMSAAVTITPNADVMGIVNSAFATVFGETGAAVFLFVSILLFAYSSIVCWAYYGMVALRYLTPSPAAQLTYKLIFVAFTVLGACAALDFVWNAATAANMLMALPNLLALVLLFPEVTSALKNQR